ncbi:MAG: hypothetical protein MUO82_07565 [Candidatus Thermoplasmatota archaeon]|nr:hypothetical protein [Candidatus Thermoplasmatota archaeon]
MSKYKTVSIDIELHKEIEEIIKSKKYYFKNPTQFINYTLIEKLLTLKNLRLKEQEIELMEKQK